MNNHDEVVLITGSSGLIGAATADRLDPDFQVIGFDNHGPPHPPPSADIVECDLRSDESVQQAFTHVRERFGTRIASVVHLAAYYDFSGEPSDKYEQITVQGTARLLRELRSFDVEQFIFSSTMLVHQPCEPGERIDEDWPIAPTWPYPESKVRTEELLRAERGGIPIVLLRIAGVYDDECHSIPLANQIQRIRERWLTSGVYPGDISHGQSFLHLNDLLSAISLLIEQRRQLPEVLPLLLGEEETLSYDELQRTFGRLLHDEDWPTQQIPKALAKTGAWLMEKFPSGDEAFIKPFMIDLADDHYALDTRRARQLLGWEPRHSLRETLPRMIEALQRDPAAWYRANKLKPPADLETPTKDAEEAHVR
jgi:nucleoside-diphosphate-sugar epimerase